MTILTASNAKQISFKLALSIILLFTSGLFFLGDHLYIFPAEKRILLTAIPPIILLGLTVFFYRNMALRRYWEVAFAFFCGTLGLFPAWAPLFPGSYTTTIQGITFLKFMELLPLALAIILPTWFVQRSLAPIYLHKGNLKIGLGLGLGLSVLIIVYYLLTSWSKIDFGKMLPIFGWMILFSLMDAFFELLMLSAILLRRFNGLFGGVWAVILNALVFGLFYLGLQHAVGPVHFDSLAISVPFGLIYCFIMQKSDAIWGSVCAHVTLDLFYLIGIYAAV